MRFKGTLVLLLLCASFGGFLYFYEIKGGEKREKAKQEEKQLWKVESSAIQQIELLYPDQRVTGVRTGEKQWKIAFPRELEADSEEFNRLASSAADISRESVVEANAADLSQFGLQPAEISLQFKTKDGKEYKVRFGRNNPTGNSTYAALEGKNEVFLVPSYTTSGFKKKLEDLRNHSILSFDQFDVQSLDLQSEKGSVQLVKENDHWWIQGKEKMGADSSAVNGILGSLSNTRLKEFVDDGPESYGTLGFEKPLLDVKLTVGKDKGIKHLVVGLEKTKLVKKGEQKPKEEKAKKKENKPGSTSTELYIARDESRRELFFVEKEFVDKLLKSPSDLRDKTLASFQRWDIDGVVLKNSKGSFTFTKATDSGDWVLGDARKKTKWDGVSGILEALEKPVKEFVDKPGPPATYGFDAPAIRVVLKQGATVKVDCAFGKETKDGVYAQVKGESFVKVADKEVLGKLGKGESDFLEAPTPQENPPTPTTSKK